MSYVAGGGVRVSVVFTDSTGAAVDPTTVMLKFSTQPGAVVAPASPWTYGGAGAIVKDSVGNYHAVLDTTGSAPGEWIYEWQGTGAVLAIAAGYFNILAPSL